MLNNSEDLWPSQFHKEKVKSPKSILVEQAALLGPKTDNLVRAEVVPIRRRETTEISFALNLVAPALNWYRLRLLRFEHEVIKLYPTKIIFYLTANPEEKFEVTQASDENAFIAKIGEIFNSPKTVAAITALIAQSEGLEIPEEETPF